MTTCEGSKSHAGTPLDTEKWMAFYTIVILFLPTSGVTVTIQNGRKILLFMLQVKFMSQIILYVLFIILI